jgi:hypothetical protein
LKLPKWLGGKPDPPAVHPELPPPTGPLREFVYLDEVSVISLVASRRGAVPEGVTRSESARDSAELSSRITANAAVLKSEVGSKLATESTRGVTTVAKSVVQATFKDLLEIEQDRLRLRVGDQDNLPRVMSADDLVHFAAKGEHPNWVVAASKLHRGDPLELEVELEADPLFRVNTVISEGLDLMVNMLDETGMTSQEISEMRRVSAVLERLLAGLVPVRGRATSYRLINVGGVELVVHRRIVEGLAFPTRDLTLVAVASRELFWKDLRRVVFSGARYTVFCRVGRSGIQRSWNPVKLAEAMQDMVPQMGDQIQQLAAHIQNAMRSGARGELAAGSRESMMRQALVTYAQKAATQKGAAISAPEIESAGLLTAAQLGRHADPDAWRESFQAVDDELRDRLGIELSPDESLDLRSDSLREAGLLESDTPVEAEYADETGQPEQWLLEVEPVAVYW